MFIHENDLKIFQQEFVYHLIGAILLFIASAILYIKIKDIQRITYSDWHLTISVRISLNDLKWSLLSFINSSFQIICFINFILYLISTVLAFREYHYIWRNHTESSELNVALMIFSVVWFESKIILVNKIQLKFSWNWWVLLNLLWFFFSSRNDFLFDIITK